MTRNLGRVDQFFRIVIGLAFVAFALRDGFPGAEDVAAAAIGMVLLLTAFFSYCPLYSLLGVSTCRKTDQAT